MQIILDRRYTTFNQKITALPGIRATGIRYQRGGWRSIGDCRRFVHMKGVRSKAQGVKEEVEDSDERRVTSCENDRVDRFRRRSRYFTDSCIIGSKGFVSRFYNEFKDYFSSKHEKRPKADQGLDGIFPLKRLSESI